MPAADIRRLGDRALLVGVADAPAARALSRALRAAAHPDIVEIVGAFTTVMVMVDHNGRDPDELRPILRDLMAELEQTPDAPSTEGHTITVPSVFDGPDLAEVAEAARTTPDQVIEWVTAAPLTVAVVGFSPGFAYLEGLPEPLTRIPRRPRPRPVVPAGSVALAAGFAAVYPTASPGGWQLIGRTAEPFFDAQTPPFARVAPGDQVRFIAQSEIAARLPIPPAMSGLITHAISTFVVERPGVRTLLQDSGRAGVAALGVPSAGPGDLTSLALANRLVGNRSDAGALEVTAQGPVLRCVRPTFVAVVGARPDLHLDGQPMRPGQVIPLATGQRLDIGLVRGGLRTYVAVAGGFAGPELFASCASDLLSGLGPGPIATGDTLAVGDLRPPLGDHIAEDAMAASTVDDVVALRVVPGPHPGSFLPGAFDALTNRRFTVEADSNRIGLRLRPADDALPLTDDDAVTAPFRSEGTVTGAVQVPPDGHPVILLPDHATMGGYPVIAMVATADHGLLGQCPPGATVVFVPIDHAEAREAWVQHRRRLSTAIIGHYPVAVE